jgi:rubrerythrin
MRFQSVEEILDFAIRKEQEAHDLYAGLAETVERPAMRELLRDLAREEMGHRRRLEAVRSGELTGFVAERVEDLRVADCLVDVVAEPGLDYREALVFAMKAEARAQALYEGLAVATEDRGLRTVFQGLAREEATHKRRFEAEYEDLIHEGG